MPGINEQLAGQICALMQQLRQEDFYKKPGIAETIDWGAALIALHRDELDAATVEETLGCIFKYNDDLEVVPQWQPRRAARANRRQQGDVAALSF